MNLDVFFMRSLPSIKAFHVSAVMAGVAVPVGLVLTGGNAIPMNGERTARENLSAIRESFRPPSVPMPIKNQVWKTTPLCSGSAIGESTNEEPDENDTAKEPTMRTRSSARTRRGTR